jgi:microcystin degradation protein MlrC
MARIAVGGFQHETNTFSPVRATFEDFVAPDAWPGLTRGAAMLEAVSGINLPATGFLEEARGLHHEIVPLTWCSAQPSGPVTRDAFERIATRLLEDLREARDLDAVYLDLHGAMVTEHLDDADGELLARVRALVGPGVPVVASLDYHANVSRRMAHEATALVSYRTYPHVDMADCGARAARILHQILRGMPVASYLQQVDFLIPLTSQATLVEPMQSLMGEVERADRAPVLTVGLAPGFPAADVADCGPSVYGCGSDAFAVATTVRELARELVRREAEFALELYSIETALAEVARFAPERGRPLILADTQDNPGAGGHADTMSLIKALLARHVKQVLAGVICDPVAAARAHAAGEGATVEMNLGAGSGFPGETPLAARFQVESIGDGRFAGTGPFYQGARFELGPMALLRTGEVRIAVASRKQQAADQAMFRHLRAEPADHAVLALKSSVHFRADFGPIAGRILVVEAPGPNVADPAKLPFRKLRAGMRQSPRKTGTEYTGPERDARRTGDSGGAGDDSTGDSDAQDPAGDRRF